MTRLFAKTAAVNDPLPHTRTMKKSASDSSLTIARSVLRDALSKLLPLVDAGRLALPVTKSIHVSAADDRLVLTGTNFDSYVRLEIPCTTVGEWKALIPAKRVSEIVTNLPDGALVTLAKDKDAVFIEAGRAKFRVGSLDLSEFPSFPKVTGTKTTIPAPTFVDAITRTSKHAWGGDGRANLHAVRIAHEDGRTVAVATTGQHLARLPLADGTDLPECSLHTNAVSIIPRLFGALGPDEPLSIVTDGSRLSVQGRGILALLPLNPEYYPNYPSVIRASSSRRVVCDRAALLASFNRVGLVTAENQRVIVVVNGDLTLSAAHEDGRAEDVVPLDEHSDPEPFTIAINAGFMRLALTTITSERVALLFDGTERAIHCQSASQDADDPTLVLVMPLRVD